MGNKVAAAMAGLCGVVLAGQAQALEVAKSTEFKAPPAQVWAAIGDFCGIAQWLPPVSGCTPSTRDGKPVRTLTMKGGGTVVEQLVSRSDSDMTYTYRILQSPLPVKNYESTISVQKGGDGSLVSWTGHFEAKGVSDDKAKSVIGGIYDQGLGGLATKVK